jgi:hypothetical protein
MRILTLTGVIAFLFVLLSFLSTASGQDVGQHRSDKVVEQELRDAVLLKKLNSLASRVDKQVDAIGILRGRIKALEGEVRVLKGQVELNEVQLKSVPELGDVISKSNTKTINWMMKNDAERAQLLKVYKAVYDRVVGNQRLLERAVTDIPQTNEDYARYFALSRHEHAMLQANIYTYIYGVKRNVRDVMDERIRIKGRREIERRKGNTPDSEPVVPQ